MTEMGLSEADKSPYVLQRVSDPYAAGAAKLAGAIRPVTVEALLALANRTAVRRGADGFVGAMRPPPLDWYAFDAMDQATGGWYPQGLSGSADSGSVGVPAFAVTWYSKAASAEEERGCRVTFLDPHTLRYRHCLLVEAHSDGAYQPVNAHAGGCGWHGGLLYVADTLGGLRVFDLANLLDLRTVQPDLGDPRRIGRHRGRFHAFGYRYVIPQSDSWQPVERGARFSYIGVDRSNETLLAGEFRDHTEGRAARWDLAADSTLASGVPRDAYQLGVEMVQGAVSAGETWYLSQSCGGGCNGRLFVGAPGEPYRIRPWAIGPEDLTVQEGRLWSVSEFRRQRAVFAVAR